MNKIVHGTCDFVGISVRSVAPSLLSPSINAGFIMLSGAPQRMGEYRPDTNIFDEDLYRFKPAKRIGLYTLTYVLEFGTTEND